MWQRSDSPSYVSSRLIDWLHWLGHSDLRMENLWWGLGYKIEHLKMWFLVCQVFYGWTNSILQLFHARNTYSINKASDCGFLTTRKIHQNRISGFLQNGWNKYISVPVMAWLESMTRVMIFSGSTWVTFLPNDSTRVTMNDSSQSHLTKSPHGFLTNTATLHTKNELFRSSGVWFILAQIEKNAWFYLTLHWLELANQWLDTFYELTLTRPSHESTPTRKF